MPGVERFYGLGLLRGLVFDVLRLVDDDVFPLDGVNVFFVAQGEGIGGDDDVVLLRLLCKGRAGEPLVAVVDHGREGGGEALDFPVPVAGDGHGADDERWAALGRVSIRRTVLTII